MRYLTWILVGLAVLIFGCEGEELAACPGPDGQDPSLVQSTFLLPFDATPNNNGFIGPFCCTGDTATITSVEGHAVGYAYFFDWKGQAYNGADSAYAPDVQILVAGLEDVHAPDSPLVLSAIELDASEMDICGERSVKAGQLRFTMTIINVTIVPGDNADYFDMGSLEARLDVSVEP